MALFNFVKAMKKTRIGVCLMHMQGNPQTMQDSPRYGDVVSEVEFFLQGKMNEFRKYGISDDRILIDPGFGFGKTSQLNISLLKEIARLSKICPVLVGLSRKRIISELSKHGIHLSPEIINSSKNDNYDILT